MKRITGIFLVICLCLNLAGCGSDVKNHVEVPEQTSKGTAKTISPDQAFEAAGRIVKNMTLEEKIGQMFLVDIDKLADSDKPVTEISDEIIQAVEKYQIGGVVLGNQNILGAEQVKALNQALSECSGIPMYIGTEEEGGGKKSIAVNHDDIKATGYTSPAEMGKSMTEGQLEDTGGVIAKELSGLGFNLNFAPAAEVSEPEKMVDAGVVSEAAMSAAGPAPEYKEPSKKISKAKKKKRLKAYQRKVQEYEKKQKAIIEAYTESEYYQSCFSSDEDKVSEAVSAMVKGMREGGVATALKTFPGISSVIRYHKLVEMDIDTGLSRLRRVNFAPFSAGIDAGTDMIMAAHVSMSKIHGDTPATLSKTILSELLRKELGFEGIILTESMDVPVITNEYTTEQAVIKAVVAGADMIYNPENLEEAITALERAVMFHEIDEKTINQAVLRILQRKIMQGVYALDNK